MCLVEIEGIPKIQAGCTLTVSEGMIVRTAATSAKAAEGQEATLEFILVNHPLDCPVCDKGGECPLQDLTFRYGPGSSRMRFSKMTFDKPIPISPLIALDRERCILCYRCTRFSEEVAEDGQLIARNRGARSEIATFEDEPYRSAFSGNVVELCPVGALTSTLYRFEARPWEIQDVPTVCTGCPTGCNITATIREGKVKRILSRNHPEIDRGWLCDKGRFTYPHLRAEDRITTPLRRGPKGLAEISWDEALDELEALLRGGEGGIVTALSGSETMELAYALGRLLRSGLGAHSAVLPEATSSALDAFRLPLSAIADAELVVVVGDDPVAERAPIVELWIKEARRRGAEIVVYSPTGSVQTEPGGAAALCASLAEPQSALGRRLREAERAVLVWSGPGGGGGARIAELAQALGFQAKPGCGAFHLPTTPNGNGVAAAWAVAADEDEANPEPIRLLIVSGDEAAADPAVRALAEEAERVVALTMFLELAAGWADLVIPATGALEREGTTMNLEGRVQRLRRAVPPPCPDELAWISKLAERFGLELPPQATGVFDELSAQLFRDLTLEDLGLHAPLAARQPYEAPDAATDAGAGAARGAGGRALRRRASATAVPAALLRPGGRARAGAWLPAPRTRGRAFAGGRRTARNRDRRRRAHTVERHLRRAPCAGLATARRRCRACGRRARGRSAPGCRGREGLMPVQVDWWVSLIQAFVIINLVLVTFAYLTLAERKVMARMQLRYGPNRVGPYGLLQPIADLLKLLNKESFFPAAAIDWLYLLAPFVAAFTALTTFSVIPFGPGWTVGGVYIPGQVADVPIALILIFAIGSVGIYGFILGGWASDSKYALLGAMRTCAQLVSYEVSLALSVLGVVIMAESLSLTDIVAAQDDTIWYAVPQFVGLVVFLLAGTAETARAPFDLPEAEQELVAGYHTEYGGMRFGLFTMSEYINLITLSGLCVTLFLGGWHGPGWDGPTWLGPIWFLAKLAVLLYVFIWMRTTLPRLRYDQLMRFGWKILLPVATLNAVVTAVVVVAV